MTSKTKLLEELRAQGIHDVRVLRAIEQVPRERFVLPGDEAHAYTNRALRAQCGQTISQPYIVALMTQSLQLTGHESVLEIGTGTGYQTAVLAKCCQQIVTIERHEELSELAQQRLFTLGCKNIEFHISDGTLGYSESAPYDAILVTAAAPELPPDYCSQVKSTGRIVIPIGNETDQELRVYHRTKNTWNYDLLCQCRFVKLIGQAGWQAIE